MRETKRETEVRALLAPRAGRADEKRCDECGGRGYTHSDTRRCASCGTAGVVKLVGR